jgi:hypothetical protein
MKYTKPQVLNVKKASFVIMGEPKQPLQGDNTSSDSTSTAYRSDE